MTNKRKVPWRILEALKDARKAATLETSSFDDSTKEKVRLHHQTWIIHPLDKAIAWAEGKPKAPDPVGNSVWSNH